MYVLVHLLYCNESRGTQVYFTAQRLKVIKKVLFCNIFKYFANASQYSANTSQYFAILCKTSHYFTILRNTSQYIAIHRNTSQSLLLSIGKYFEFEWDIFNNLQTLCHCYQRSIHYGIMRK